MSAELPQNRTIEDAKKTEKRRAGESLNKTYARKTLEKTITSRKQAQRTELRPATKPSRSSNENHAKRPENQNKIAQNPKRSCLKPRKKINPPLNPNPALNPPSPFLTTQSRPTNSSSRNRSAVSMYGSPRINGVHGYVPAVDVELEPELEKAA